MIESMKVYLSEDLLSLEWDFIKVIIVTTLVVIATTIYLYWKRLRKAKNEETQRKEKEKLVNLKTHPHKEIKSVRIQEPEESTKPALKCPFQAIFEDIQRARAAETAASQDEQTGQDFLAAQLERDKIIEERLVECTQPDDDMFLINKLDKVELTREEREKELALKRTQLEAIFELLKKQEQERLEAAKSDTTDNQEGDREYFEYSVLNEDGSYEKKEIELKKDFESQMRLYGL